MNKHPLRGIIKITPEELENRYPELKTIAKRISNITAFMCNELTFNIQSEMPYKAGYVLEEVIKLLQEKV